MFHVFYDENNGNETIALLFRALCTKISTACASVLNLCIEHNDKTL